MENVNGVCPCESAAVSAKKNLLQLMIQVFNFPVGSDKLSES